MDEKALRESFVVVPPGDEVKSISCPVCKETLKSEFRDEDEEWVWTNAVRVKDKVCHRKPFNFAYMSLYCLLLRSITQLAMLR